MMSFFFHFRCSLFRHKCLIVCFEEERFTGFLAAQFVHGGNVEHPAVDNRIGEIFTAADIVQYVAVGDHNISQFTWFDTAQVFAHAQVSGTVDGSAAQRFPRGEATFPSEQPDLHAVREHQC